VIAQRQIAGLRIAKLNEKSSERAMDALSIVKAFPDERHDVGDGLRRLIGERFEREGALRGFDDDDRNGLRWPRRQLRRMQPGTRENQQQQNGATTHAVALASAGETRREIFVTPTRRHIPANRQSAHRG